jgi:hypothetical protein
MDFEEDDFLEDEEDHSLPYDEEEYSEEDQYDDVVKRYEND